MKISNEFVLVAKISIAVVAAMVAFGLHMHYGAKYNSHFKFAILCLSIFTGDAIRDYIQAEKRREAKARKQAQQQIPPIQAQLVKAEVVDRPGDPPRVEKH